VDHVDQVLEIALAGHEADELGVHGAAAGRGRGRDVAARRHSESII
jgi:hypothetical protein